jgi:CBS domain-containing protein
MAIGDICKREVAFAGREMTVQQAAKLMRYHHVGSLVVVDPDSGTRRPVGIVTDRDIVMEINALDLDPKVITIGDIMNAELVTVPESFGLMETTQLMRMKGVRRVPVVDTEGNLSGIVTSDDVLEVLAEELTELAQTVSHERSREVRVRS